MRDVDERHADVAHLALDPLQLDLHLLAQLQVERAERLVEQEQRRRVDDRAGECDALTLPTGELHGLASAEGGQADALEDLLRLQPPLAAAGTLDP